MAENAAKRARTDASAALTIGTHNGHFHADEALAVHMLRLDDRYQGAKLVRTRDPAVLATCDIVVDVGGEYDAAAHRYDHHQRGFTTTFPGRPTKLSSAGLVYMHFGTGLIQRKLAGPQATERNVELIYRKLYESFIEALDAHDNGISKYDPAALTAAGIDKGFSDGGFTLGAMVGRLNPNWNESVPDDPVLAQQAEDAKFLIASARIGEEFDRDLEYYTSAWIPARTVVETAFSQRLEHDAGGRILVFKGQSAPWKDHLYSLEEEQGEGGAQVQYVLYPESGKPDSKWRVQCVPVSKDSFTSRKPLPEAWRGFRDEELDKIAGVVPGSVFVHASGFIGGHKTFEGAMQMAKTALEI